MEKMLLQSFTEATEANENAAAVTDENKALSELMHEMEAHLENAAHDLLQPRQEALDKILKKQLH